MSVIKALPAQVLTFSTTEALVEGDFVVVSGDMAVSKATAGVESDGVVVVGAEFDLVSVLFNKPVLNLVTGGAVVAGADLEIGATGVITKATGVKVGIALKDAVSGGKTFVALTV